MSVPAPMHDEQRLLPSGALSLLVHGAFVALLVYTVQWQNRPAAPVQAELWNSLPALPQAELPPPELAPAPAPPPAPEPPRPAPLAEAPPPPVKPAIVVEKAKPLPPDARKLPDPAAEERARLAHEEAALKQMDRDLRAQAARDQAEQARREQSEEQRLAQLQRIADARQKADAQQAQANLLRGAQDRIIARIRENTIVPASVPAGVEVVVKFVLLPDGSVLDGSVHLVSSSGNPTYDDAVQRAIIAAQPLPMPDDVMLRRTMRDIKLKVNNIR
ncbi:MAG: cell envelope integrity protein TolA [Pseudomonadota bacterium]|nr:cell envelope integrity protein TolA [Pseudomonadota bacterium]